MADEKKSSSFYNSRLQHFLYMGDEGNRYVPEFISKRIPFCLERVNSISTLLSEKKGVDVVNEVIKVCEEKNTICMDAVIFTLALCATCKDEATKHAAYKAVLIVCSEAEHLFTFVNFIQQIVAPQTGWGRGLRRAVSDWYNKKEVEKVAVLVTKCTSHRNWRHKDLICLSHIKPANKAVFALTKYLMNGIEKFDEECDKNKDSTESVSSFIHVVHELKHTTDEHVAARLIDSTENITFSHIPMRLLKSKEVWSSLLRKLPISVLLKQINRFRHLGYLKHNNSIMNLFLEQLREDSAILNDPGLDPINVFVALKKYEMLGKSSNIPSNSTVAMAYNKGLIRHKPNPKLLEALYNLFYSSFKALKATEKQYVIAVDVRNPMTHNRVISNTSLTPAVASALLIMSLIRQDNGLVNALAFGSKGLRALDINNKMTVNDITRRMKETAMGFVNLSEPLQWAQKKKKHIDMFIICTDTQTSPGDVHPADALKEYRKTMNLPNAKYVVCAMSTSNVSIAPPDEPGMLDLIGFDSNTFRIINDFACDKY
ncbi:SS-A/Ro ribonucleoprotein [Nymphon striatum]|nr:SS-A/Ro ribonucleoprotein [Nymphon striatum]